MTHTRRRTSAVLLSAAVGLIGLAAPASAAEDFTVTAGVTPVVNGPPGSPEIELEHDLYVPTAASATDRRPAIVMASGFGLSKASAEVTSTASLLARNGYVVLAYTPGGFGGSGGCITLQSADYDARGTAQLVDEVLEPRTDLVRDADGLVLGTVGGSYGGGWQLVFAAHDDRVRAANPGRTWNLLRYSLSPNNRIAPGDPTGFSHELNEQGVFKAEWASLFFASGMAQPVGGLPPEGGPKGGCAEYKLATGDPSVVAGAPCLGFLAEVCEAYARINATGDASKADRALLDRASAATFLNAVVARQLPVLLFQGQRDTLFKVNDAMATYTRLQAAGVPVQMVWNWGGHGGYDSQPGECDAYGRGTGAPVASPTGEGLEDCYLTARTLAFFDAHLRGSGDAGPGFAWHRDWLPFLEGSDGTFAADEQYGTAAAYPAMPSTTFTLSGSDVLVPPGGSPTTGSPQLDNPPGGRPAAYSESSNFSGPNSNPRDPRAPSDLPGQHVAFTGPPFTADVESVGVPRARLTLSHQSPGDLFLFGKVYDVAPDGTSELVHRMVAPVRVPADAVDEPIDVALNGFAHRFPAGHAVRLVLSSTDAAYRNSPVADSITVTTGSVSTFSLPLPAGTVVPPVANPVATPVDAAPVRHLADTGAPAALPAVALLLAAGALALRRRRASPTTLASVS